MMRVSDEVRAGIRRLMAHEDWSPALSGTLSERPEWSAYSNGACAVLTRGVALPGDYEFGSYSKAMCGHMDKVLAGALVGTAPRADLLEFCGPEAATAPPCETCASSGYVECVDCDGETECVCPTCGDEHDNDCSRCGGDGAMPCPKKCGNAVRPKALSGTVHGILIDRRRLRELVEACPFEDGEEAELVDVSGNLGLRGAGWLGILMCLRPGDEKDVPAFRASTAVA